MKVVIQDLNELTDSRELLDTRPHPFITIFIYTLLIMLLIALIWSYLGEIDIVVKAGGVVRPNEKISTINNKVMGKVENIFIKEGQKIAKGQTLYAIEHITLDVDQIHLASELQRAKQELANLEKFKSSILDRKNFFDNQLETEAEYYRKYLKFETDCKSTAVGIRTAESQAQKASEAVESLMLINKSIALNKNLLTSKNGEYYNQLMDYMLNMQRLEAVYSQKNEDYNAILSLFDAGAIAESEMKDAKASVDDAKLDLAKYKNEFELNINSDLEKNKTILTELGIDEGSNQLYSTITLDKYITDTIVQIDDNIKTMKSQTNQLEKNLETQKLNIQDCTVLSPIDGTINIITDINEGDLLQSGVEVATIVPDKDAKYKIQLYVNNKDIANIRVGDTVKYHFLALPYKEYGELTGQIIQIGTDAKIDQQKGGSFYIVEADIENKPLYSYKGIKSEIKVGMICEANVISKTKKILDYLLEKINLTE